MRFPTYPKYKPSGVEWLADIPQHWDSLALRRRFRVVNGGTPSSAEEGFWDGDITWLTPDDLGKSDKKRIVNGRRQISKQGLENCGATLVPKSSLIVSTRAPIGYVAINDVVASTNQGCRALVSQDKKVFTDFFYYVLIASTDVLQAVGKGTTFMELSAGALASHFVPIPSLTEQQAIADFLDAETANLDTLVAKKLELIEKLKEKRSALISRTVTRGLPPEAARATGLNPNPKLKPSGIEWLGEIPEHWEMKRLKFLLTEALKYGANESAEIDDPELPRYVRITDIAEDGTLRDDTFRSLPQEVAVSYLLREGDILFARSGATSGKTFLYARSWGVCAYAGYLIRARFNYSIALPEFVRYFTASANYWQWLSAVYIQATIQNVSAEKYGDLWLPVPSVPEQRAIADYLDHETSKIDRMVAKVEEAIERLQEYRTALITAAVTGKIDVRGYGHNTEAA